MKSAAKTDQSKHQADRSHKARAAKKDAHFVVKLPKPNLGQPIRKGL